MTGNNGNTSRRGGFPAAAHSAVERLNDIKTHQWSFLQEVRHNWQGWLGSFAFHAGVVAVLMAITWPILVEKPPVPIDLTPMKLLTPLDTSTLQDLLKEPLKTEKEPSFDTGGETRSVGYPELDQTGVPDWIGMGPLRDGPGPGGPPGIDDWPWPKGTRPEYRKLDIVFVFDSTGSMGGILLEVKTRIRQFTKVITYLVPNTRLGLVTYRDRPKYDDQEYEYTVKYTPLTAGDDAGLGKLQDFLRGTQAWGGGDIPEAIYEGLATAIQKAGWRKDAKKIIIIFGDAPPRPEDNGLLKICDLCRKWHDQTGGVISCIDTTGGSKLLEEFMEMAACGGGQSCFLNDERAIIKQLVLYVFPKEVAPNVEDVWKGMSQEKEETILEK